MSELRKEPDVRMCVRCAGHVFIIGEEHPSLSIGRGDGCDAILRDPAISRLHCKIEFRSGKFFLVDSSTNGTLIEKQNAKSHLFRRITLPIEGRGHLHFAGRSRSRADSVAYFEVLEGWRT